ncbi:MAG: hypothetical protein KAY32_02465 [Candidatus Eisenbacteria sp.]|nr:hypothetical protein [Candidatus Eisenbacteria bacterium]
MATARPGYAEPRTTPPGCHRILRLARTIADPAECAEIEEARVGEAVAYRVLDRR